MKITKSVTGQLLMIKKGAETVAIYSLPGLLPAENYESFTAPRSDACQPVSNPERWNGQGARQAQLNFASR